LGATYFREHAQLEDALRAAHPTRDYAIYEINVRLALEGRQELGPCSHWFHHPGPSYFYFLAVPYALGDKSTFSLYAAGQLLTFCFLLATAVIVCRWAKQRAPTVLFVPLLALEMAYLGAFPLFDFWPPYVLFFGYGLFVVLCAGLAAGRFTALAPTLALASLLVQTHVSYAPVVLLGLVFAGVNGFTARSSCLPSRVQLCSAAAVLVLLWAAPLHAELFGDGHNLRRLFHVFVETRPRAFGLWALTNRVALELSGAWQFAFFRDRFIVPEAPKHYAAGRLFAVLLILALAAGWRRARRADDRFSAAWCALCLLSVGAAAWSLTKIRGEVAPHHTAWISALGWVGALAAASGLFAGKAADAEPRPLVRLTALAALSACLAFVWPIPIIADNHVNPEIDALATSITAGLRRARVERPRIAWGNGSDPAADVAEYDWATAVMLELEKRRVPFFVTKSRKLRWMIGMPRWEASDEARAVVHFTVGEYRAGGERLACAERGANFFMRYPVCAWLERRERALP
jgi:hypothetical protein